VKGLLQRLLGAGPQVSILSARWVAIDCETSGLNPARDRLLAVGAVAVREARIEPADSFHALADAFSAAQLLLVLLAEAGRQGVATVPELRRVAASSRWIAGR
jgi:DNA polymerase III epsilon subunit-like protein